MTAYRVIEVWCDGLTPTGRCLNSYAKIGETKTEVRTLAKTAGWSTKRNPDHEPGTGWSRRDPLQDFCPAHTKPVTSTATTKGTR